MKRLSLMAAFVGLSLVCGAGPAAATDQSAAVQLCAKNPQCGLIRGRGGVNLWVDIPGGGTSEVWCPDQGECVCQLCGGITRQAPKAGRDIGFVIRERMYGMPSLSQPVSPSGPIAAPAPVPEQEPEPEVM